VTRGPSGAPRIRSGPAAGRSGPAPPRKSTGTVATLRAGRRVEPDQRRTEPTRKSCRLGRRRKVAGRKAGSRPARGTLAFAAGRQPGDPGRRRIGSPQGPSQPLRAGRRLELGRRRLEPTRRKLPIREQTQRHGPEGRPDSAAAAGTSCERPASMRSTRPCIVARIWGTRRRVT